MSLELKKTLRAVLYPGWNALTTAYYRGRYHWALRPDAILHGQRGNDYERHRRRVAGLVGGIAGKDILVFGCGTGKDIPTWLAHQPRRLVGLDYFAYPEEWKALREKHPNANLELHQQSEGEGLLAKDSFDILASDAVLEHLQQPVEYLQGILAFLKPGGLFYSTFGPVWHGFGGDHLSGYDSIENGYAHLMMSPQEYQAYVDAYQPGVMNRVEDDPRLWIRHDLFSRLDVAGYQRLLVDECALEPLYVAYLLEPKALKLKAASPERYEAIRQKTQKTPEDLDVTGITFIGRKRR